MQHLQRVSLRTGSCKKGSLSSFHLLPSEDSQGPAQLQRQMPCRAQNTQNTQQTPSKRATPGACPGLASAPSAGPRVNKNHQMERKLLFHRGKRLPFGDLQPWSARRLRPQVKWGSPWAPSGSPAHHRGTAQKGHGRPTSFPPRHVAGEE